MKRPFPEHVDCPNCGARNRAIDNLCASCKGSLTVVILPRPRVRRVGLATVMVAVAVLALCFAAMHAALDLGVALTLFLVPAALRAGLEIESRRADGRPMNWSETNASIALAIMLAILLMPVAGIAFAAMCVPLLFATAEPNPSGPLPVGMIVALACGLTAGVAASFALGRFFWPPRD